MFQNVSALHIFVLSNIIPLYEQTTFNYSFTSRWTLVLRLLFGHYKDLRNFGTVYKVLCGHVFSVFLGVFLGVALLGHTVTLCLTF